MECEVVESWLKHNWSELLKDIGYQKVQINQMPGITLKQPNGDKPLACGIINRLPFVPAASRRQAWPIAAPTATVCIYRFKNIHERLFRSKGTSKIMKFIKDLVHPYVNHDLTKTQVLPKKESICKMDNICILMRFKDKKHLKKEWTYRILNWC